MYLIIYVIYFSLLGYNIWIDGSYFSLLVKRSMGAKNSNKKRGNFWGFPRISRISPVSWSEGLGRCSSVGYVGYVGTMIHNTAMIKMCFFIVFLFSTNCSWCSMFNDSFLTYSIYFDSQLYMRMIQHCHHVCQGI